MKIKEIAIINPINKIPLKNLDYIYYIDTASVLNGFLICIQKLYTKFPSRAKRSLIQNDILISSVRPNLQHNYFANFINNNCVASTGFIHLRVKLLNEVNPRFLFYWLTTKEKITFYSSIAEQGQTTFPSFNKNVIENLDFPKISIKKQQHIVNILGSIDDKIEKNELENENLLNFAQIIADNMFSKKIPNNTINDILISNIKSNIKVNDTKENIEAKYKFFTSGVKSLMYNDFLIDGVNIFLNTGGNAGVKIYKGKCSYSTDTWSIRTIDLTEYLFLIIRSKVKEINDNFFEGSALKHLQKKLFINIPIYIPNHIEKRKLNLFLNPLFEKIFNNYHLNDLLKKLKILYLQKFFNY